MTLTVDLTKEHLETLQRLAHDRGVAVEDLIRTAIDQMLTREALVRRAKAAVGGFASGSSDGSVNHDQYFADSITSR